MSEIITFGDIKDRLSIRQVVGSVVELDKKGRGRCCFHSPDKHPSLTVSDKYQKFTCWACGACGDIYDFTQRLHGLTKKQAFDYLAQRAGFDVNGRLTEAAKKEIEQRRLERERKRQFCEWIDYWRDEVAELIRRMDTIADQLTPENIEAWGPIVICDREYLEYLWEILAHGTPEEQAFLYKEKRQVWGAIEW